MKKKLIAMTIALTTVTTTIVTPMFPVMEKTAYAADATYEDFTSLFEKYDVGFDNFAKNIKNNINEYNSQIVMDVLNRSKDWDTMYIKFDGSINQTSINNDLYKFDIINKATNNRLNYTYEVSPLPCNSRLSGTPFYYRANEEKLLENGSYSIVTIKDTSRGIDRVNDLKKLFEKSNTRTKTLGNSFSYMSDKEMQAGSGCFKDFYEPKPKEINFDVYTQMDNIHLGDTGNLGKKRLSVLELADKTVNGKDSNLLFNSSNKTMYIDLVNDDKTHTISTVNFNGDEAKIVDTTTFTEQEMKNRFYGHTITSMKYYDNSVGLTPLYSATRYKCVALNNGNFDKVITNLFSTNKSKDKELLQSFKDECNTIANKYTEDGYNIVTLGLDEDGTGYLGLGRDFKVTKCKPIKLACNNNKIKIEIQYGNTSEFSRLGRTLAVGTTPSTNAIKCEVKQNTVEPSKPVTPVEEDFKVNYTVTPKIVLNLTLQEKEVSFDASKDKDFQIKPEVHATMPYTLELRNDGQITDNNGNKAADITYTYEDSNASKIESSKLFYNKNIVNTAIKVTPGDLTALESGKDKSYADEFKIVLSPQ